MLSNLNKAKRAGFRYASIIAFRDGKPLDVRQARKAEADYQPLWSVRIWPLDGKSLGESEMKAIRSLTSADIAKSSEGGVVSYLIGPFSDTAELDSVISGLRSAGITNVRSERLPRE